MERLHRIVHTATPYLVLAALAVVGAERMTEPPPAAPARAVIAPAPRVAESRVVHVFDDRTPAPRLERTRPPIAQAELIPEDAPDEDEDEPEIERELEAQAELRAERLERGHVLVDGMLDLGVAEAAAADELRDIVASLPHDERIQIYARITTAVNDDELEVDPDHLPM